MPFTVVVAVAVVMAVLVVAVFVVVAATASTAATFAAQHVEGTLQFFVCSGAVFYNEARELQRLASQRVVQVNAHALCAYFEDGALEIVAVFVHQGNDVARKDVFGIKLTVNAEHVAVEVHNVLLVIRAVGLFGREREAELSLRGEVAHARFEGIEGNAYARDKLEGLRRRGAFYQTFCAVSFNREKAVGYFDVVMHDMGGDLLVIQVSEVKPSSQLQLQLLCQRLQLRVLFQHLSKELALTVGPMLFVGLDKAKRHVDVAVVKLAA